MILIKCNRCNNPSKNELCGRCRGKEKQREEYKSPYREAGINAAKNNGTRSVRD